MSVPGKGPRVKLIPPGDNRERLVCPECDHIVYDNPKIVVGSVVTWDNKVLLCKRAIEPRLGYWTLPAGFLEAGESPEEGAKREAREEACCEIEIEDMLAMYTVRHISQIQIFYRAHLLREEFSAGPESSDVRLFGWDEIPPHQELAFPTVPWSLAHYRAVEGKQPIAPFFEPPK